MEIIEFVPFRVDGDNHFEALNLARDLEVELGPLELENYEGGPRALPDAREVKPGVESEVWHEEFLRWSVLRAAELELRDYQGLMKHIIALIAKCDVARLKCFLFHEAYQLLANVFGRGLFLDAEEIL